MRKYRHKFNVSISLNMGRLSAIPGAKDFGINFYFDANLDFCAAVVIYLQQPPAGDLRPKTLVKLFSTIQNSGIGKISERLAAT